MKAVQIERQGGPEELHLVDLPDPQPGPGEILIEVESASVNFSDVMRRRGDDYPVRTALPFVPGGEIAGTVDALGEGVEGPDVGTPVFAVAGADGSGGYAELALASASGVIPIPEGLDSDQAAGIIITGLGATLILTQAARLGEGESVLVPAAAGSAGSFAVQIAKHLGAGTVIGAASTEEKRRTALGFGADHVVDYTKADWDAEVREITGGAGVDVALEMVGGERLAQTLLALGPFGRLVVYGHVSGTGGVLTEADLKPVLYDPAPNQSIYGFNLGPWFAMKPEVAIDALGQLIGWVASGAIKMPATSTLPLADAAEAHRLLEAGRSSGKLILKP